MKSKFLFYTTMLIFVLSTVVSRAQSKYNGDSWASVLQKGNGTISLVYYQVPGLIYTENGTVKGVYADIISSFGEYVYEKYSKSITFNYVAEEKVWADFLNSVKYSKSGVFGVGNVTITEDRKQEMDFTPAVIANPMVFLTHSSAPNILSYEELKTKLKSYKAIAIEGSTQVAHIRNIKGKYHPGMEIVFAHGEQGEVLVDVISEKKNLYSITDFTEYYDAIKRRLPVKRHSLKMDNDKEYLGMIMPKNSDWTPIWNEFLTTEFKTSNRYKEIITKNLGVQFLYLIN